MSPSSPQSDSSGHDPAARLLGLEEKIMFQQRGLEELNEVILRQQGELDQLRREVQSLRSLSERVVEQAGGEDLPHEKPPHY